VRELSISLLLFVVGLPTALLVRLLAEIAAGAREVAARHRADRRAASFAAASPEIVR